MRVKDRLNPGIKHILTGTVTGLIFLLIATAVTAFVLTKSDLGYQLLRYTLCFMTAVAAFVAGFVSKKKNRLKGIVCGLISGMAVLAVVMAILLIVCGVNIRGESVLLIPSAMISGMLGGVISSNVR